MESTWPTQKFCVGDPMQTIFHRLTMGFVLTQILGLAMGVMQILAFLDTTMLV